MVRLQILARLIYVKGEDMSWWLTWIALMLTLVLLVLIAVNFRHRTLRWAEVVIILSWTICLTRRGFTGKTANFIDAFLDGAREAIQDFFKPFFLILGSSTTPAADVYGIMLSALMLLILAIVLEINSIHRESPTVYVQEIEHSGDGAGEVAEELKFRLPAVEIKNPPLVPGNSAIEGTAAVVEALDFKESKALSAIVRLIKTLQPQPRSFFIRLRTENQTDDRGAPSKITIDLRETKTYKSVVVRTLPMIQPEEAAQKAAAFIARYVLRQDPAVPIWMAGSLDGEDLAAYLEAQMVCDPIKTQGNAQRQRQKKREILSKAVKLGTGSAIVRNMLASIYEEEGELLGAMDLHLLNRVLYPDFLPGRFGLALSLSMIATAESFKTHWAGGDLIILCSNEERRRDEECKRIAELLQNSGIIRNVEEPDAFLEAMKDRKRTCLPDGNASKLIRKGLLDISVGEFQELRRIMRWWNLARRALFHRRERIWAIPYLANCASRRNFIWMTKVCQYIAEIRRSDLLQLHDDNLRLAKNKVSRFAHHAGIVTGFESRWRERLTRLFLGHGPRDNEAWSIDGPSWRLIYNIACLHAIPPKGAQLDAKSLELVIRLLKHAIYDPSCTLTNPSEWLNLDPDLRHLLCREEFKNFLSEVAYRNFER